jgi:hypothetical protein
MTATRILSAKLWCASPRALSARARWISVPRQREPQHALGATGQRKSSKFSPLSCMLQVVARGLARVVVFEDDVRFKDNFRRRLERLMEDVLIQKLSWDLM